MPLLVDAAALLSQRHRVWCRCHCCILTARSDYFAALLSRSELSSSETKDYGGDTEPSSETGWCFCCKRDQVWGCCPSLFSVSGIEMDIIVSQLVDVQASSIL